MNVLSGLRVPQISILKNHKNNLKKQVSIYKKNSEIHILQIHLVFFKIPVFVAKFLFSVGCVAKLNEFGLSNFFSRMLARGK